MRHQIEKRCRSGDSNYDIFRVFEINLSAKREVYIFGCEIQKLKRSVTAIENGQGAGSNDVYERAANRQLAVYELEFTNDAGTFQCLGKRQFSTQNSVFRNV